MNSDLPSIGGAGGGFCDVMCGGKAGSGTGGALTLREALRIFRMKQE